MLFHSSMRPGFVLPLQGDGQTVMKRIHERLGSSAAPVEGQVLTRHAFLQFPDSERSLLSPYLNLHLRDGDNGGRELSGRFSPHPAVWTGFMALYGVLVLLAAAGVMFGWAQTTVDEYPWGFWVAPVSLTLIVFVYGASVIGQGLTANEMHVLRRFVERSLHEAGEPIAGCDT